MMTQEQAVTTISDETGLVAVVYKQDGHQVFFKTVEMGTEEIQELFSK